MKNIKNHLFARLFLLLIALSLFGFTASAQNDYNPLLNLYVNPNTGNVWHSRDSFLMDNMVRNMQQQMFNNQMLMNTLMQGIIIENMIKENTGREKLKAGKISTRFVPSPQESIVETMVETAKTPAEKQQMRELVGAAIQAFNDALKAKKLAPYDAADADALAFVLNYIVYKNEDPGETRLFKMRNHLRNQYLKDLIYQGTPDKDKQKKYETRAFRTMLAIKAAQNAKRTDLTSEQRKTELQNAKSYATAVLKELWTGTVESIELSDETAYGFGDKGERLVKTGAGTTTFNRVESMAWAEKNSYCYEADGYTRRQGDTSCFLDMRARFDRELKALGGQTNDLAFAQAVAFKLLYEAYTAGKVRFNDKQFAWVLKQMQDYMLKTADWQNTSDQDKQDSYDYLAFTSVQNYDRYQKALQEYNDYKRNDPTSLMIIAAQNSLNTASSIAYDIIMSVYKPLQIQNYELREDGFVKIEKSAAENNKAEPSAETTVATTTFVRDQKVMLAAQFARNNNLSEAIVTNLMREFDQEVKRRGGATNDAAWVNAVAFAFAYEIYTNGRIKLNQPQLNWVLKEMQKDVLAQESYQKLSNQAKQEYYEYVALETMIVVHEYRTIGSTPEIKVRAEARMRDIFNPRNIDDYTLTPTGFVKK